MRPLLVLALLVNAYLADALLAQPKGFNYDEEKVPEYELPDPLVAEDGTRITTAEQWTTKRRPELVTLFEEHVYGRAPGDPTVSLTIPYEDWTEVLDGAAIRRQVRINFTTADAPGMDVLMFLPKSTQPVAVFLGLNFRGNHTIHPDPAIHLPKTWVPNDSGAKDNAATEDGRGVRASRWPVEALVKRGFGLVTIYCGDIDPDYHDEFRNGVHGLFAAETKEERGPGDWGTIAAWAWGLSQALDHLETEPRIDAKRVAVIGHSRLGKTALWAGARDERFAMVVSNDSGCGGAALSRRAFGETVKRINTSFPHWFCGRFKEYDDNESACPVDQHELVALAAPRPVYIASATGDQWADPRGEFLSGKHASPVYELLGRKGLTADEPPAPDTPVQGGYIGYHLRTGKHDITEYDWQQYMDFFEKRVAKK